MTATIEVLLFDLGGVLVEVTGVSAIQDWTSVQSSPASIWEKWLVSPAVPFLLVRLEGVIAP